MVEDRIVSDFSKILNERGIRHTFIAAKLGISPQALSNKLRGRSKFNIEEFLEFCKAVGKDPNDYMA